jgi:predicted O-methyltransferase YrrM
MTHRLRKAIRDPKYAALRLTHDVYNRLLDVGLNSRPPTSALRELNEVQRRSLRRTDISDHLVTLFVRTLEANPRLIVELGVRGGESTFVLERVAALCDAALVSVDIEDCSDISAYARWEFVRMDDVAFGREFAGWCRQKAIEPAIDVLFVDTSHVYEHTRQEIKTWLPLLASKATVFFHDTNLRRVYFRNDGSMGIGWDNERGVIKALEEHFGTRFDEKRDFADVRDGWSIEHRARCNGFTILTRLPIGAS